MKASSNEAERDRIPHHRRFRDLTAVPTDSLERTSLRLSEALQTLRDTGASKETVLPLMHGIIDCERELIRRIVEDVRTLPDNSPPLEVIRISHRSGLHIVGVQ